jgi:hypothetical protein
MTTLILAIITIIPIILYFTIKITDKLQKNITSKLKIGDNCLISINYSTDGFNIPCTIIEINTNNILVKTEQKEILSIKPHQINKILKQQTEIIGATKKQNIINIKQSSNLILSNIPISLTPTNTATNERI